MSLDEINKILISEYSLDEYLSILPYITKFNKYQVRQLSK